MSELAVEYAKALYSLSADMKIEDKILDEIKEIKISFCENPDFIKLLNSPALSLEERHKVAEEALGGADVILVNFVKLLTEGRLVHIFSKCAKVFEDEYNLNHNIEVVTVESALPLSEGQISALKDKLQNMTGKTIIITDAVRPELIGGIVVKMRDKQYDGSISKKLNEICADLQSVIV